MVFRRTPTTLRYVSMGHFKAGVPGWITRTLGLLSLSLLTHPDRTPAPAVDQPGLLQLHPRTLLAVWAGLQCTVFPLFLHLGRFTSVWNLPHSILELLMLAEELELRVFVFWVPVRVLRTLHAEVSGPRCVTGAGHRQPVLKTCGLTRRGTLSQGLGKLAWGQRCQASQEQGGHTA